MRLPARLPALRLAVTLVATTSALGLTAPPSLGACAAPALESKGKLHPGATVVIHGMYFHVGCADNAGGPVGGCGPTRRPDMHPMNNIRVTLTQDGKTYLLAVRDANQNTEFRLKVKLPEKLHPGRATLRADGDGGGDAKRQVVIRRGNSSLAATQDGGPAGPIS